MRATSSEGFLIYKNCLTTLSVNVSYNFGILVSLISIVVIVSD